MSSGKDTGCGGGNGPCGACKFLRRKCVRGCIFSPYFDAEEGTVHFAAVHRVFGASNASKLLQRVVPQRRLHAVLTLCYEAHARLRDPVYGCVAHIFALQQQVVSLETELAFIQAQLSVLDPPRQFGPPPPPSSSSLASLLAHSTSCASSNLSTPPCDPLQLQPLPEMATRCSALAEHQEDEELKALAQEFLSKYSHGVKFQWPADPIDHY